MRIIDLFDLSYVATGVGNFIPELPRIEATGAVFCRATKIAASALLLSFGITARATGAVSARSTELVAHGTTGGVVWHDADGRQKRRAKNRRSAAEELIESTARLEEIRKTLSLNAKQLASAMRVGRPALYRWMDGATPNEGNLTRLKELYDIAQLWSSISAGSLGKDLITPVGVHGSLMSLLVAPDLDRLAIESVLEAVRRSRLAAAQRRKKSGYRSPSSIVQQRGFQTDSDEEQRRRVEDATDL